MSPRKSPHLSLAQDMTQSGEPIGHLASGARPDGDAAEPWGLRNSRSIPAGEILAFQFLLNRYDHAHYGCCDYDVTLSSIRHNVKGPWVVDGDSFTINQLGHPYQGSMYHGFARASGLGYWQGLGYTFLGSALWEIAGETTQPSRNDQISTGIGGSFLGEALFRMANLWLEQNHGAPMWRDVAAAAISPAVGFNRFAFGSRFRGIFPSHSPDYYSRVMIGWAVATQDRAGSATEFKRHEALIDFTLDYGLPGKEGYTYSRPFDYFSFQASAASSVGFDSVLTHGLLLGTDFALGNADGIWGLYGSYEYMAPQAFRFASTALSPGTTVDWRIARAVTIRGTALIGIGYATVSTIGGATDEHSNHYGVAPQALTRLRVIFGRRASLDLIAREYFVSKLLSGSRGGHDNVVRSEIAFVWRVQGEHGLAVRYQLARRDATFPEFREFVQSRGTIGLFYTNLGRDRFGGDG